MGYKKILYNTIVISLPKNAIQFFLGVTLFWLLIETPNPFLTATGLLGFLLTYSSVYLVNDIFDYREDMKDREKRNWKLITSGLLSFRGAKILAGLFVISGLLLSILVNKWFFLIMVILLFLNLLHSSPPTRFKNSLGKTSVNMTTIQFLKYSSGWFALTSNISNFPFWLILAFSLVYTLSYIIYKLRFMGQRIKGNKKLFGSLTGVSIVSYLISFVLYGFPLSLIVLVFVSSILFLTLKHTNLNYHKTNNQIIIEYLLLHLVIVSFLLLVLSPTFAEANSKMVSDIDQYVEKISERFPPSLMRSFENISNELNKYKDLEDLEKYINLSPDGK